MMNEFDESSKEALKKEVTYFKRNLKHVNKEGPE